MCRRPGIGSFRRLVVDPDTLEEHLDRLAQDGWHGVAVEDLDGAGPRDVALTFDDGYADFHAHVLPLLQRYGVRASLYLPTAYVDGRAKFLEPGPDADRRLLTWSQVRELAESGHVEIGGHAHTHPQLDRVDPLRARAEVRLSKILLEQELQREVTSFAYPFGYHDRRCRADVSDAGYRRAVAVSERPVGPHDGELALPRLTIELGMDAATLMAMLQATPAFAGRATAEAKRWLWRGIRRARLEVAAPNPLEG
ncbi:MAG: polysaccharide deacetylase family protein [Dermatophilaceae bacterium]